MHSTKDVERLYPEYRQRLGNNLSQYNDFVSRARRLSVANDGHLFNRLEMGYNVIQEDDFQIFTKWIITYFHAIKRFNQFYRVRTDFSYNPEFYGCAWFPLFVCLF